MAGKIKVTKGVFDAVKLLLQNGATASEIKKYFNICSDVVSWIRQAETYEEYMNANFERNQRRIENRQKAAVAIKAKEQQAEQKAEQQTEQPAQDVKQVVQVQLPYLLTQEIKRQNELLEAISNKLAYIVQDLYGGKADA